MRRQEKNIGMKTSDFERNTKEMVCVDVDKSMYRMAKEQENTREKIRWNQGKRMYSPSSPHRDEHDGAFHLTTKERNENFFIFILSLTI
jgi:hypothetical protein